jgi:CubicO group peptidase (beta-lactamase class C family)
MRIRIILSLISIVLVTDLHGQDIDARSRLVDRLLQRCYEQEIFNGVALVAENGEVLLHKSYGHSDFQNNIDLELTDRFYIGSLTKQFTSTLILILWEEGVLDIHERIGKYIPEYSSSEYEDITIYHLLTHRAGLSNYTAIPEFDKARIYSREEFLNFSKRPLLFEPGSSWQYSNTGYYLLGLIAERSTESSYASLLKDQIFKPLGMHDSGFDTSWIEEDRAYGHWLTIDGIQPMPDYSLGTLFSSGGVYSTAEDLYKWDQSLYNSEILSDSLKEILFKPVSNDYACGWYVKRGIDSDGQLFERHFHGGWIKGYHAFMLRRIPDRQVVILLDNTYSQELQTIKNAIWSILIGENPPKIKPMFSKLLFEASSEGSLRALMDSVFYFQSSFAELYDFEEFDINKVAYRLMEADRLEEANMILIFNMDRYPDSWNVYDSLGELRLKQGNLAESKMLYERSLELNPGNVSAREALSQIDHLGGP